MTQGPSASLQSQLLIMPICDDASAADDQMITLSCDGKTTASSGTPIMQLLRGSLKGVSVHSIPAS
jgi:hypothetical protein